MKSTSRFAQIMHEGSLVKALLRQVDGIVSRAGATRATVIHATIGDFAGVESELFRVAFHDLVQNTAHRGASLEIRRVPLRAACQDCEHSFLVPRFRFQCPRCGSLTTTIVEGEGLVLESVIVEAKP